MSVNPSDQSSSVSHQVSSVLHQISSGSHPQTTLGSLFNASTNVLTVARSPVEEPNILYYKPAYKEHRGIHQQFGVSEAGRDHHTVHLCEYEEFEGFETLQMNINSAAIVLCTTQENLKKYFATVSLDFYEPERKVVIKIFDYCHLEDSLEDRRFVEAHKSHFRTSKSYEDCVSYHHKNVLREIETYNKIWEYNKGAKESKNIDVPFLYDYGNLHLKRKDGKTHFEGFFVLLDYAGVQSGKITKDQFEAGARHLNRMSKLGIEYHRRTAKSVCIKDGTLYLIAFKSV